MEKPPIKIELVGLLPAFYRTCTMCQPVDYLLFRGVNYISEQLADYPPAVLEEQKKLYRIYQRLARDFSGAVVPVPVDLLSARGAWLSLRHGLIQGPAVIVNGKRALSADVPYERIRRAIDEERTKLAAGAR